MAITHRRVFIDTENPTKFYGVIRKLSLLLDVLVVRNPYNRSEGFYIIGTDAQVSEFESLLKNIFAKVDMVTSRYKKNQYNRKLHFSEAKQLFRGKCIRLYEQELDRLIHLREFGPDFYERYQLRKEYHHNSNLKSKKALHAKPN